MRGGSEVASALARALTPRQIGPCSPTMEQGPICHTGLMDKMEVNKVECHIAVSAEVLAGSRGILDAFMGYMELTPEQREQRSEEQKRKRADERAAAERVPLTLETLSEKLGFSDAYLEHLVQPYCNCGTGDDWMLYCAHAYDEGHAGT